MKIKNGFLKKTSIYFIGTLSTKMISVMLVPIYAYFVAVSDLSDYDYFATIASTLSPIVFAAIWEAILKFGIDYNQKKASNIDLSSCYINELGALKSFKDEDFYELIVFADVETSDTEIKALISQLLHFNKY